MHTKGFDNNGLSIVDSNWQRDQFNLSHKLHLICEPQFTVGRRGQLHIFLTSYVSWFILGSTRTRVTEDKLTVCFERADDFINFSAV